MAMRLPSVRHFIACRAVITDPNRHVYSLEEIIYLIRPAPGESFPLLLPEMYLFAILSDARGTHEFWVQVLTWDAAGEEIAVWKTITVRHALGQDPLTVFGWPIRLRNLRFEHPGLYEFRLWCDGTPIASEPILLRAMP